jgi:hypothetical protein
VGLDGALRGGGGQGRAGECAPRVARVAAEHPAAQRDARGPRWAC